MHPKNPKDLYGINIPEKPQPNLNYYKTNYLVNHTCSNCGNIWNTEIKAVFIANALLDNKYDYCSECYKNS